MRQSFIEIASKDCFGTYLGKKAVRTVKHPIKANVWGCFSSKGLGHIVSFKQNLNAELMCDISKRDFLPTARKQFGYDSTLWKLQQDNDPKHTWKLAVNWKRNDGVHEIHWPSMSPHFAPIENVWQVLKMNLRRKRIESYRSFVSAIKREWKSLLSGLTIKFIHSMNKRISEVIESHGDFILR